MSNHKKPLSYYYPILYFLYAILWYASAYGDELEKALITGIDSTAQLPFWEWQSNSLSIRLVQRLPDQTRGYFMARGFNKQQAEQIAQSCIFQTIFKNKAKPGSKVIIEYDLSKWRTVTDGKKHTLKLREDWDRQWQKQKVTTKAQIAMRWSLLPTRQHYQAQDYNWGMTAFDLTPGAKFNLEIYWKLNGQIHTGVIPNVACASDIHPDPNQLFD